ncbi:MAG: TRAP transporter large permease subunit, partial [Alphaproteobacteria bacterium]|nr:TRAP transporter large permease subunit [Alphaproteobacteria bacterium]
MSEAQQTSPGGVVLAPARLINNLFVKLIALMNSAGTVWVFFLMFLICADIIARAVYNAPIRGVAEIVGYTIVGAVFLQLAHCLHVGRFARAEMFIEPQKKKRPVIGAIYEALFSGAGTFVFALIAYGTWFKFEEAMWTLTFGVENEFTVLVWPLRAIILFGASTVAIKYAFTAIEKLFLAGQLLRRRDAADGRVGWHQLLYGLVVVAAIAAVAMGDLGRVQIGLLSFIAILGIIFLGLHIGVGLIVISFAGIWIMMGEPRVAINAVKLASNEFLRVYFFGVVPLFVLMGLLINESGIGKDTFDVARWALRRVKGGLGVATVLANAIFAAITGSSIASAAVFTKVATPHMRAHGYTAKFAVGNVA